MIGDAGNFRHQDPDVLSAPSHAQAEELFYRQAVAHFVDERRDVVEPVGIGHDLSVGSVLTGFFEAPMQIADLHVRTHDRLAIELQLELDDAVHGGMRRPHVEEHVVSARLSGKRLQFILRKT